MGQGQRREGAASAKASAPREARGTRITHGHDDTIDSRIQDARRRFEHAGIDPVEAAIDADVLARHALGGWERGQLMAVSATRAPRGFRRLRTAGAPPRTARADGLHHRASGVLESRDRGRRWRAHSPSGDRTRHRGGAGARQSLAWRCPGEVPGSVLAAGPARPDRRRGHRFGLPGRCAGPLAARRAHRCDRRVRRGAARGPEKCGAP